jgi:hypothetical protein
MHIIKTILIEITCETWSKFNSLRIGSIGGIENIYNCKQVAPILFRIYH